MPQIAYPDTIRAVAHLTFGGEEATNTWHFRLAPAASFPAAAGAINIELETFYDVSITAPNRGVGTLRSTTSILDRITFYDLRTLPYPVPLVFTHATPGSDAASSLPLSVSMVLSLRTAVAGRSGRGRIYVPHLTTAVMNSNTGNFVTADAQLGASAIVDLATRINTADPTLSLAVLSVVQGVSRDVIQVVVNTLPDTQRRRDEQLAPVANIQNTVTP